MLKVFTSFCLLCIATFSFSQKSSLSVKVIDSKNLNLPGASVRLTDNSQIGITNNYGIVIFTGLEPKTYHIVVTYIGYEDKTMDAIVDNTQNEVEISMTDAAIMGSEVIIVGDRLAGQSKALSQQKNSDNISNIVSADQIGRFPDSNIGDAVKRIPGITMQNDQGEARNIVVRGMGPEFNSVTLNGERIPSAEGDNRRVQMDLIPSDIIQTIEVNKTLTPDMDADAIGGSVNLLTKATPNAFRVSGTLSGGYNPIREDGWIGAGQLSVGGRLFKKSIGWNVNGSYNKNRFGSDNVESTWQKDANGKVFVDDHDIRSYDELRIRRSLTAALDFKLAPGHKIYLDGNYNWRDDKENRYRLRHRYKGDEEDYADDLNYDAAGNITGYANGEVLRQTKGGLNGDKNEGRRLEDQRVRSVAIRGEHLFGRLGVEWSGQYAKASEVRPNERYVAYSLRNIEIGQDISDAYLPLLTDNVALADYNRLDELTEQFQDQYELDKSAKVNFELPVSILKNKNGQLKFGAKIKAKEKVRNNTFYSYEPTEDNGVNFENISQFPLVDKTNNKFYPGDKYKSGQFIDPVTLGSYNFKNSNLFEENDEPAEYLAGNYEAKEIITSGYVSFKQDITDKFSALIGVRLENTDLDYTGNIVYDEEDLEGKASFTNNYLDVLPSLTLRYAVNKNFIIKGAYTNSLARPKYYDLVPYFNINVNDEVLSVGNSNLNPVRSSNIDLMAENYFQSIGIVSGGIFYKKLDNFFYNYIDANYTTEEFATNFPGVTNPIEADQNWEFTQRRNGNGATVLGAEVAIQRQLDFLPGFWKGFGVYLNYTFTHSKAEGLFDADGELVRENVKLPGAAPHIFNTSISYENKKFSARISGNFTSSYVDDSDDGGYNADSFFDRYYDKQFFLDVNASYTIHPKLRIFAEVNNITNQPLRYYQGIQERTTQLEYYGQRYNLGIKFDLIK